MIKMPKKLSHLPLLFPLSFLFSFFSCCLCCSNLWCSAEDKSPEQLNTLAPRLERWHIAHIFFIHFQKYLCDGFFAWITVRVWQSNTPPFILGNYTRTFCLQFLL